MDTRDGPAGKHKIMGVKEYLKEVKIKWNGIWSENLQHNLYDKPFHSNQMEKNLMDTEFCHQKKTKIIW